MSTKKKSAKAQPMNYGPYVLTPPNNYMPLPMWRVIGPALEMASTSEATVRMRASEANAIYQKGFQDGLKHRNTNF